MKFNLGSKAQTTVLPVFKTNEKVSIGNDIFQLLKEKEIFSGDKEEVYMHLSTEGENILFIGLGEKENLDMEVLRRAFFNVSNTLNKYKIEETNVEIKDLNSLNPKDVVSAIVEGFLQATYKYDKFLTDDKKVFSLKKVYLNTDKNLSQTIEETKILVESIFLTRDLVNEPAMYMTPDKLAKTAKEVLEPLGVGVEIFEKEKIKDLGMEAFLAVAKGSSENPKFIIMEYMGDKDSDEVLGLVGKGLTYDSGGYCIKSAGGMLTMQSDMAGAGSVIGTMKAVAEMKLKKNVVAVVAACENLISGKAYKTGDIVGSMAGKTIEVINTDAEGRLTLADALYFITTKTKANKIVDIATLTGACVGALANVHTGAITNNSEFMQELIEASKLAGEPVWELPNHPEYREFIKSHRADLRNSGKIGGGTITAGQFLEEFVNNKPWIHLDIAGTAYFGNPRGYLPKDATGIPVKTLYNLAKNY